MQEKEQQERLETERKVTLIDELVSHYKLEKVNWGHLLKMSNEQIERTLFEYGMVKYHKAATRI